MFQLDWPSFDVALTSDALANHKCPFRNDCTFGEPSSLRQIALTFVDECSTCRLHYQAVLACFPELQDRLDDRIRFSAVGPILDKNSAPGSKVEPVVSYEVHTTPPLLRPPLRSGYKIIGLNVEIEEHSSGSEPESHGRAVPDLTETEDVYAVGCPSGDTSSHAALEKAEGWLRSCTSRHTRCGTGQTTLLPRRVIDVLSSTPNHPVRLRETGVEHGKYICLSHCWGSPTVPPLQTTKETYNDRINSIAWSDLPKTFQDTINFARELSITRVWIDSLCIIQNDKHDWENEAAKMASVYANAYLTIAAAAAPDCHAGLHAKTGPSCAGRKLKKEKTGYTKDVYAHRWEPHVNELNEHPLMRRAWVFQERMLSPRVLYFTGSELNWECNTEHRCECGGMGSAWCDKLNVAEEWQRLEEAMLTDPTFSAAWVGGRRNNHHRLWTELVQGYLALNLSYQSDIFPALAGLARRLQHISKDVYWAGLWKQSLIEGLAWRWVRGETSHHQQRRRLVWRAPTWSWASVEGGSMIVWEAKLYHPHLIQIHDAVCRPSGPDELGALDDAWIDIFGHCMRMILTHSFPEGPAAYFRRRFTLGGYGTVLNPDDGDETSLDMDYALWDEGPRHLESGTQVIILPIIQAGHWIVCLVLAKFEQHREVYERIGLLMQKYLLWQFPLWDGAEGQRRHDCWEYRDFRVV